MASTRDQIIEATCDLIEAQGFHATGLNQILKESRAPKGSLYYYFPDGKDGLVAEAIERTGHQVAERIRQNLQAQPDFTQAFQQFIEQVALAVESSGFRSGGPLTTVAMETATTNPRLNQACRDAFALVCQAFAERLQQAGYPEAQAAELALVVTATIEGGIILSRTNHSGEPLRQVARHVAMLLQALPPQ